MAYYGNEPAKVALKIGSGVITTTEIQDGQVYTADILDDAITSSKIDDDGTGFQVGSLGIGTSVTGVEKLTVGGTASFSGAITGDLTGDVTGDVSGSSATVTGATQSAITEVGTLTSLATSGEVMINNTSSGNAQLYIKGAGTGTANSLYITDSAGADILYVKDNKSAKFYGTLETVGNATFAGNATFTSGKYLNMNSANTNWLIGRNIGTPSGGYSLDHAMQIKVYSATTEGFEIYNHDDENLLSIQGSSGSTWVRGTLDSASYKIGGHWLFEEISDAKVRFGEGLPNGVEVYGLNMEWYGAGKARINDNSASAGSPTYSFNSDNDTGMYRPSQDELSFATDGVERMSLDSHGNLIIKENTQDPDSSKMTFKSTKEYTDDEYENFTLAGDMSLIMVTVTSDERGAVFMASKADSTVQLISGLTGEFATSDTDGKCCVYKSGGTMAFTVKNRLSGTKNISVAVIGCSS